MSYCPSAGIHNRVNVVYVYPPSSQTLWHCVAG